ncbi:MAG: hypothetical protein LBJ67_09350 [Planctomycetaceae bacterium]|nr:hypothetical protein [Planctomycetaceae bacterium]
MKNAENICCKPYIVYFELKTNSEKLGRKFELFVKVDMKNEIELSRSLKFSFHQKRDIRDKRDFWDMMNEEHCLKSRNSNFFLIINDGGAIPNDFSSTCLFTLCALTGQLRYGFAFSFSFSSGFGATIGGC